MNRGIPGHACGGGSTRPCIVHSGNIAAVETNAGPPTEEHPIGRISRRNEQGRQSACGRRRGGRVFIGRVEVTAQDIATFAVVSERLSIDLACPRIMHGCKTALVAECNASPNSLLGGYEVGKALADLGKTGERCQILNSDIFEDFYKDFSRNGGDRTRWWRR